MDGVFARDGDAVRFPSHPVARRRRHR
jgi:hypothetical protein